MAKIDDSVKKKVPELRFPGFTDDWEERKAKEMIKTHHFRSYLELTEPYFDTTISNAGNIAGVYIVGSDQVWNCDCTFEDYHYFLDFVEDDFKKK